MASHGFVDGAGPEAGAPPPQAPQPGPPGDAPKTAENGPVKRGVVARFADRGLLLAVAIFVVEMVLLFAVANLPFLPGEQAQFSESAKQISNLASSSNFPYQLFGIFANNMQVALIEMVPGAGALFFGVSIYNTARVIEVLAVQQGLSPSAVVTALFFFPHSWIELPAYAVATAEGIYVLRALARVARRRSASPFVQELGLLAVNVALVAAVLAVAALFETIQLQTGLIGLVLWLPFGGLLALAIVFERKLASIRRAGRESNQGAAS